MPFAFHGDLLSTYHRSYLLLFEGSLRYFNPQEVFQAIGLWFFSFLVPLEDFLVWSGSTTVTNSFWLCVLDESKIFSIIFLLKSTYLIFDIAICILFLWIFKDDVKIGSRVFIFWILNPIIIFSVYIFGRFEVIPIFFILLSLYLLKKNNTIFGGLFLGIAIISRYYPLLLVPFILISFFNDLKERIIFLLFTSIPILLFNIIVRLSSAGTPTINFAQSHFIDYILGMKFVIHEMGQAVYIFVVLYVFIVLSVYYYKNVNNFMYFSCFSLITFLLFYSTSLFHPHYFVWFIPFLAIYYGYTADDTIIELHCLQIACFIAYTFYWGEAMSTWIFASMDPELLKSLPPPINLIDHFYPSLEMLNIFRSGLSAISIFIIVKIVWNFRKEEQHEA
jgi:hypothetical protein